MKVTKKLRDILLKPQATLAPGAFDGLSARLVEQAGFELIYASGGAIARSSGFPDIGLLSFTEICERIGQMVEVTNLPIIADADTGYGNSVNVYRTMKCFEKLGIAGLHLEDQQFPKRCGHLEGKALVSQKEMVHKLKIARDSFQDSDFVLIARTDAIAVEGFDKALERAHAYLEAGADMIFVEAPETEEHVKRIAEEIKQPKLINMFFGGKTPLIPLEKLNAWGYRVVIIPSDLQRASIHAMQNILNVIKEKGDSAGLASQQVSFKDREKIIRTEEYLALDRGFKE